MRNPIIPRDLAFDVDGVVADTMDIFVRLARERYGFVELTKEHLSCYDLYRCLDMDREIVDDLIRLTLNDENTELIPPMPGAADVLTDLACHAPLYFVTARIWSESITAWLHKTLPDVPKERIHVIATGAPEAKLQILRDLRVRFFVDDRLETCRLLAQDGIQPLLFDQPWNRVPVEEGFPRIESWTQFRGWVFPQNGD